MSRVNGAWLAVLGPDGTGKSTLIDTLERRLGPKFTAVRRYHLRPHFGGGGTEGTAVTEPHARAPRGSLASLAKLVWWWVDCVVGWIGWIRPARRRGELVLFDRYVDDLAVDPRRYRYGASPRWAHGLARLVPRPDAIVVLDAPVDVIRSRAREVAPAEIERQRGAYRALASERGEAYLVDASGTPDDVADEAERRVRARLEQALSIAPTTSR